jgi:hypothetical protein
VHTDRDGQQAHVSETVADGRERGWPVHALRPFRRVAFALVPRPDDATFADSRRSA